MKFFCIFLSALVLAGCTGTQNKGVSHYDDYDSVKIEQMVGNNVSGRTFEKTIVCLNARRETRRVSAVTNVNVALVTNQIVTAITNQTISISTNYLFTLMTNLAPQTPGSVSPGAAQGDAVVVETNVIAAVTNAGPSITTNSSLSLAANQSATTSPSQAAANSQFIRTYNNQITTASNNLTVSLVTNLVVTSETNQVVNYVTNSIIATVTNIAIVPTNFLARDYYLLTEMTPPADFTLQSGESLVLLVDGVRHGFSQSQPASAFVGRKRFTTGLYRVSPEVLVAIANAKDVKLRFKGVNSAVEKSMSESSRQNFKTFLLKYFTPEQDQASLNTGTVGEPSARVASR